MAKELDEKKRARALELAKQIELLFQLCVQLVPYKDLIRETADNCAERQSYAGSAAVLIAAAGGDYEAMETEARIRKERAEAFYNLVDTLERTEAERAESRRRGAVREAQLRKFEEMFGVE